MASLTASLTEEQKQRLCALLGDVELTLLYKASVHGYHASAFHRRCDRQGPTLLVAHNSSGYVFGGYTSVDYTQSGRNITDDKAFLFNVPKHGGNPITIKANSGCYARFDDSGGPNFGHQLVFCYNNSPWLSNGIGLGYNKDLYDFNPATLYRNDTQLAECEMYKVTRSKSVIIKKVVSRVSADQVNEKQWRNVLWTVEQKQEFMKCIKDYKPLQSSVNRVRILMIGPVGAGKSSFFNSINSIFMGRMTNKAMAGSSGTSLTTQFRLFPVKDGREGKPLPFVLCDTMGLEEQSGAGLDIEDISCILQVSLVSFGEKQWRNMLWTTKRRGELVELIKNYKPLDASVNRVQILLIGPVGAGKSSFFNSINSIFTGHVTNKAMAGSSSTSLTTQFRTYQVKDGREGKLLPFVLCDTMGLEEQSGAGLDIEDIGSILQGLIPDRYTFNPVAPYRLDKQTFSRSTSLEQKIHCVVYVIDATKISLMSSKLEEKLAVLRRKLNLLPVPQIVLMTKVDEACPLVEEDLQKVYVSSYIKTKVQEVSSRLGVPVSCVLPVKNYSQELELNLSCDVLLLTALQQMLRFADDYFDDISPMQGNS